MTKLLIDQAVLEEIVTRSVCQTAQTIAKTALRQAVQGAEQIQPSADSNTHQPEPVSRPRH